MRISRFLVAAAIALATLTPVVSASAFEDGFAGVEVPTTIFTGITIGDLVKLPNDHNPATTADSVVYYFDRDWKRHPFPNKQVFDSWYGDFSRVREVTPEQLAAMRLGKPVIYRPGTRLIKIPSIPKVYAVEPGGVLRWITTEEVALALYGKDWSHRVDDVSESFFIGYTEGPPLRSAAYPTGTLLRLKDSSTVYMTDGKWLRSVTPTAAIGYRFQSRYAVDVDALPSSYSDGGALVETANDITDTAQLSRLETLPPPQIDFPERSTDITAGTVGRIASFRITAGQPVSLRRMSVKIDGAWNGSTPVLSDLQLVDRASGEVLYGTRQLEQSGAGSETVPFNGAALIKEDATAFIDFVAKVDAGQAGKTLTITFDHDSVDIVDGTNADNKVPLMPQTPYPALTAVIK